MAGGVAARRAGRWVAAAAREQGEVAAARVRACGWLLPTRGAWSARILARRGPPNRTGEEVDTSPSPIGRVLALALRSLSSVPHSLAAGDEDDGEGRGAHRQITPMEMGMNSVQPNAQFPVPHKSLSLDIKGNKTDIVISKYEDSFLVIVTQIGCMGTILAAKKDESVFSDPTYNVSVLFGKRDEPLLLACARQLIEHISGSGSARSLMISLGLKDHAQATIKDIVSTIIENRLW